MSRQRAVLLVVVVIVLSLPILEELLGAFSGGRSAEDIAGSSYSTGPDGVRAWSELLALQGRAVARAREQFDRRAPDPTDVIVEVDIASSRAENAALARHLEAGGRIVLVGPHAASAASALTASRLAWSPEGPLTSRRRGAAPEPESATVEIISGDGTGSWRPPPSEPWRVLFGDDRAASVVVANVERGRVVAIADPSIVTNRRLAVAGNAALAIGVTGTAGRVVFAEAGHGFGPSGGVGALPPRWRIGLALGGFATAIWMWSRAKRFGAPDLQPAPSGPSRVLYVESLAASLARTRDRAVAAEPLRVWVDDESRRMGRTADVDAVLSHPTVDDHDLIALAAAAADQTGRHP